MARLPRLTVAGYPHHLIQRGHAGFPVFRDQADYELMLLLLADYAGREKVAIHGYVLLEDRFHLLATPGTLSSLPRMMQDVGRKYVQHHNRIHLRSGTLWEGRYRSTVVQPVPYVLACMAHMELTPVHLGYASDPGEYPWSSYRHNTGMHVDRLISPHPAYWELGNTPFAREAAYARYVEEGVSADVTADLTRATLGGWALGDKNFVESLQALTHRRLTPGQPGRPVSKSRSPA